MHGQQNVKIGAVVSISEFFFAARSKKEIEERLRLVKVKVLP